MSQSDWLELAQRGDPNAIANWLSRDLEPQGITVSIDREDTRLSIGLYGDPDPAPYHLVPLILHRIEELHLDAIRSINLFSYRLGNPIPVWSERVDLAAPQPWEPRPYKEATGQPDAGFSSQVMSDRFLVCGLGDLGQYCVFNLKRFALKEHEVHISAIEKAIPQEWEVNQCLDLLAEAPIIGDCRSDDVLLRAGVRDCRAILVVTSDESDNIEAAITARRLNPAIRLIVRSSRQSLNQLLKQRLGNFAAFEPTELSAAAFALAGFQQDILGFFNIGDYRLQVVQQPVKPGDYRFDGFHAALLHKRTYRLLSYTPAGADVSITAEGTPSPRAFYQWQSDTRITAGDRITFVEVIGQRSGQSQPEAIAPPPFWQQGWQNLLGMAQGNLKQKLAQGWQWVQANQTRRIIGLGVVTALSLWLVGAMTLRMGTPMSPMKAAFSSVILLLGGYGDVFGGTEDDGMPFWVHLTSLLITLISLLFVLGVLGLIADNLLSSRFEFLQKRPPIPKHDHVVIVGLGRVGQRVAKLLREFKQPLVSMTEQLDNANLVSQIPVVLGNPIRELTNVNLATAKSIIVVTDDQMLNLEVALMAREAAQALNRHIGLVIRTYGQNFSNNLINLLPDAKVLSAYSLAGEAFAGAAFGENILGLFRLNDQTILVTEYCITANDTLVEKLLSQVAYGYGVVPIFHQRKSDPVTSDMSEFLMPIDDRKLHKGDRLIVLSSMNGLRRIERGEITPPRRWRLEAQKPLNATFIFDIGKGIAKISGCSLDEASTFVNHLPGAIELPLYDYQAYRLESELSRQLPMTLTLLPDTEG